MGEFNLGSGERPNPHCGKKHSLRLRLPRILTNGKGKNFKVQGLCLVKMRDTEILLVLLKVLLLFITLRYWLEKEQKK